MIPGVASGCNSLDWMSVNATDATFAVLGSALKLPGLPKTNK